MTIPFRRTRIAAVLAGLALALAGGQAAGTGFQLNDQSASSIGNAFAGGAAFTDDVSAMWWNPAALSKFSRAQAAGVIHLVTPSIKFRNDASQPAANQPLGGDGGDAGGINPVPNMYVSVPINPQFAFGLGVNVPFGLTTEYGDGWLGRYQALKSQIKTINVNPAISWRVTPEFTIGAGANYQYIDATLTNNVNYSGALLQAAAGPPANIPPGSPTFNAIKALTPGLDAKANVDGDDDAWGWNVGLAWDITPQLRFGAAYRSEIRYNVSGNVNFDIPVVTLPPGTSPVLAGTIAALAAGVNTRALYNSGITSDIELPQIANFSLLYRIDSRWEVMGDVQWTGWSSIPELRFTRTNGATLEAVPLEWDDTYKISVGTSYRYNDQWKARFGVAFDQTPVTSHPTPRLPDSDRWWLALGGEYRYSPALKFDAGFVYIFADSPSFDQNRGNTDQYGLINGSYDANVVIFSLQGTYSF